MATNISQAIVTIAQATVAASQFPGISIEASSTDEWTFNVSHSVDHRCDCEGVTLDKLRVAVGTMVDELEGRYGPGGVGLEDAVMPATRVNSQPA